MGPAAEFGERVKTVTVPAITDFVYEGRAFSAGQSITVSPVQAAALHRQQKVSLTRGYRTAAVRAVAAEPEPESEPTLQSTQEAGPEPEQPRQRRRYRRRDLTAESE